MEKTPTYLLVFPSTLLCTPPGSSCVLDNRTELSCQYMSIKTKGACNNNNNDDDNDDDDDGDDDEMI